MDDQSLSDLDLTCWYLNPRRVIELIGAENVVREIGPITSLSQIDGLAKTVVLGILKDNLIAWLRQANVPTLGQLLLKGNLRTGVMFTHYDRYFCRGLSAVGDALHQGRTPVPPAEAYAKLDTFRAGLRLSFRFRHEHLTSNSSWSELSGQRRLLILGAATHLSEKQIDAIPWVMGDPLPDIFRVRNIVSQHWGTRLEVHIDSIDNFEHVGKIRPSRSKKELQRLRDIPETAIKNAVAEIIDEQTIPKDWGGEGSDLFSTWVSIDGRRISTAFAFKGPSKFHPMTLADLGKNGDQINRLFKEPADLLVLQHCHEITPPVREVMRAFAQQIGNPRLFCLINGYDTLRLLRAYGKCGFES